MARGTVHGIGLLGQHVALGEELSGRQNPETFGLRRFGALSR
ncbi:hypothetical protein ACFV0R_14980 [Streptomyces sp. NPDC059578]